MFDDTTADMISNKKLNSIVTKLFTRGKKRIILLAFTAQSYFKVAKGVRLNSMCYFIVKIPNKRELQQIVINHSPDIDLQQAKNKLSLLILHLETHLKNKPKRLRIKEINK